MPELPILILGYIDDNGTGVVRADDIQ